MRATFSSSSTPSRELDAATPRPSRLSEHPPLLYDSAHRGTPDRPLPLAAGPSASESARTFGTTLHDLYSPSARAPHATPSFQTAADFLDRLPPRDSAHSDGTSDAAESPHLPLNMPDQPRPSASSDSSSKPPSRGRTYSNTSRRGQFTRQQPFQPPPPPPSTYPSLQDQQTAYHGPPYQPSPSASQPYAQRGPYVGGSQYTMTPPPMLHAHSQPHAPPPPPSGGSQYAYPSHPGLHAPDTSMHPQNQLLGYATNTLMPMMPPPPHYPFPPDSPSSHAYAVSSAAVTPPLYSPAHPSPTAASYAAAARYSTPPAFMYPSPSFSGALYQTPYSYGQQYRPPPVSVPAEPEARAHGQGTWWYLPPGTRPAPSPHYDAYVNPYSMYSPVGAPDQAQPHDPYAPGSSVSHYPLSPLHPPYASPQPPPPLSRDASAPDPPPPPSPSEPARSEPASSQSILSRGGGSGRPSATRRAYHPNPPANRSEWVMWAGNVPSDASHDELWRFFTRMLPSPASSTASSSHPSLLPAATLSVPTLSPLDPSPGSSPSSAHPSGVSSIFLISRSNCAFVNFASEAQLHAAIARFNGQPLRPLDARCPRLVCRIRGRDDDLKAGVGGQRGAGVHMRWVREQKAKERERARAREDLDAGTPPSSSPAESAAGHEARKPAGAHSNSSGSYASTNSSTLAAHFPKRYFILKSLSQADLDTSVEEGVWATQKHNEGILDQAWRTSKDVYLIFGVNRSGEFYGYARMAGPILSGGDRRVSWASRSSIDSSPPARRASSSSAGGVSGNSPTASRKPYFSPGERVPYEDSPLPLDDPGSAAAPKHHHSASAPAVLLEPHRKLSTLSAGVPRLGELSFDRAGAVAASSMFRPTQAQSAEEFTLDPKGPEKAARQRSSSGDVEADEDGVKRWDAVRSSLGSVREEEEYAPAGSQQHQQQHQHQQSSPPPGAAKGKSRADGPGAGEGKKDPTWGESFKVEWLRTTRLPFWRTRHLRNPWNHEREVKVSRDGTELEPGVGQALVEEWDKPEPVNPGSSANVKTTGMDGAGAGKDAAGPG